MSHHFAVSHLLRLLAASAVAVSAPLPVVQAQGPETDVRNFRASDVSGTQLQISVDVLSPRPVVDRATLRLAPVLHDGAVDPTAIEVQSLLGPPNATTTTVVLRKRDGAPDFVSVAMQICVLRPDRAEVCRTFSRTKRWSANGPPSSPTPPPAHGVCTITGHLTGPLEGLSEPDTPGPRIVVRLRHMAARADGQQSRSAVVHNRQYTFTGLPAGARYRVVPAFFRSTPPVRIIDCRPHITHRANFHIIGPAPEG